MTDNLNGTYSGQIIFQSITEQIKNITFNFSVNNVTATQNVTVILFGDQDLDGVSDALDLCPLTNSGLEVDADGCALYQKDTDNDGVYDD